MDDFKERMNYKKYGGAPLVGVRKPVFKAHGSADAYAVKNTIAQAVKFTQSGFIEIVENSLRGTENE